MKANPDFERLRREPWNFEFVQALRVLLRDSSHGEDAGTVPRRIREKLRERRFDVEREPVRIGAHNSLEFPASDIQSLQPIPEDQENRWKMKINFLGLTGPAGVLPLHYTEDLGQKDSALSDFFDIFNHRLAMLFYYVWEKHRLQVLREHDPENDFFQQMLLELTGVGFESLQHLEEVRGRLFFFARYAALLAIQTRPASAIQAILTDYFGVPVEVEEFVGTWRRLDEANATWIGQRESVCEKLGYGVVAGRDVQTHETVARVRVGPLDLATYQRFLPEGDYFMRLRDICRFFSRDEVQYEIQPVLDRTHIPGAALRGAEDGGAGKQPRPRLGWTTWAALPESAAFREHAQDVRIRLC